MNVYSLNPVEKQWLEKNKFEGHVLPGVQTWYTNDTSEHFIHDEKTREIIAVKEFYVHTVVTGNCDLVFHCIRYNKRNRNAMYEVTFREHLTPHTVQEAFELLDKKIKRFPDKKVYELFNSCFVDKEF